MLWNCHLPALGALKDTSCDFIEEEACTSSSPGDDGDRSNIGNIAVMSNQCDKGWDQAGSASECAHVELGVCPFFSNNIKDR